MQIQIEFLNLIIDGFFKQTPDGRDIAITKLGQFWVEWMRGERVHVPALDTMINIFRACSGNTKVTLFTLQEVL